jgi:hypothetical protein
MCLSPPPTPIKVDYLLSGIFSRACKALGNPKERVQDIAAEAGQLRGLLADRLLQVLVNLEGARATGVGAGRMRAEAAPGDIVRRWRAAAWGRQG